MLSHEENELLTRVGPGTAMGELMRRYWIPAAFTHQVADDIGGALSMLRQLRFPQGAGVRIDARGAPDRLMNSRHPAVHLGNQLGIEGQVFAWIWLGSNGFGAGPGGQRDGLVIPNDRHVKSGLQEFGFSPD